MAHKIVVANLGDLGTHQVFQVVRDWALSGLAGESIWIDSAKPSEVNVVNAFGVKKISTNDWMSSGIAADEGIRVFSLQVLRDAKSGTTFNEVQTVLASHPELVKASSTLVNLIVPVEDLAKVPNAIFFDYRLNVVVAPADGTAPTAAHNLVTKKSPEVFSHAAASLVSVAGFWHGQNEAPLDKLNQGRVLGPGQNTMISRAFVRYVDAADLVSNLIQSVALTEVDVLPVAVDEKGKTFDFLTGNQAQGAIDAIAEAFFAANANMLAFKQPPAFRSGPLKSIGFIDAIKLYFSFVFKWLWAAPGEWAREKLNSAKASIAASGQKFLGSDSQYEVIVKGVSARSSDSNSELDLSQEILDAARAGLGSSHLVPPASPFQLWESMVSATCNLADGGVGFDAVLLPTIGADRVLVREPVMLTPDSRANNFDVPARLPIPMSGARLRSDDPYSAYVVMDQIEDALRNSGELSAVTYTELNQLKLDVQAWVQSNRSFVWQIGLKLALQLNKARLQLAEMYLVAQNLGNEFQLEEAERNARMALMNVLKGGIAIIGAGGLIWLGQAFIVFLASGAWPSTLTSGWWLPATIFAVVLFIWNILGMAAFNAKVGEFFDLEKKINEAKARSRWATANLQVVLQELHRLASLYGQYRLWVKVLSPMFYREAGVATKAIVAKNSIKNLTDLPKSVVVAELSPDPEASEELFSRVRNSFYKRGWLKSAVDSYITQRGMSNTEIWADTAQSSNSELVKLAALSVDAEASKILSEIAGSTAKELASLGANFQHWTVLAAGQNKGQERAGGDFIDVLRRGGTSIPVGSILTARASVQGVSAVSLANSFFAYDQRLDGATDVSNVEAVAPSALESRSLDFMAVRLELTDLMSSDAFGFTTAPAAATATETEPQIKTQTIEG
jgi:hypothetical protein